ncbi:MAG: aromatic-ring-hydroxylating dioxygenase subunit alpha [Rhodospirillaceae bacterium]|nr:aromatic-ring-hydroxylating dioxygenase subunit alpha [Rhodospirillaceae bacterium]
MSLYDNTTLESLIKPDRVHKDYYIDPDIFELEMDRIFSRSWLIVGHESQIPKPGDFLTLTLAKQPVIMSRHRDNSVHVLFNRCTHRGAKICNKPSGNSRRFECPYHGWAFHTNGDHAGVPYPQRYSNGFITDGDFDLPRPPRMEIYRGFVFIALNENVPELSAFLGPMQRHIDNFVNLAPDGEVEACAGMFRYRFAGNWKIQLENLNDLYHPMFTHASTTGEDGTQFRRQGAEGDEAGKVKLLKENASLNMEWENQIIGGHALGHTYMERFPMDKENSGPVFSRYRNSMKDAYGDAAESNMKIHHHNSIFFPHWSIQYMTQHIRIMNPISVDCTENIIIPLKLKGAPEEMWYAALKSNNNSHSPAGMVMADDMDAWTRCQSGMQAQGNDWIVFARSIGEEKIDNNGSFTDFGTSEANARHQHKAWLSYMCGNA